MDHNHSHTSRAGWLSASFDSSARPVGVTHIRAPGDPLDELRSRAGSEDELTHNRIGAGRTRNGRVATAQEPESRPERCCIHEQAAPSSPPDPTRDAALSIDVRQRSA